MAINLVVKDTKIAIGDTVKISQKIKEGDKERAQSYEGVLIAIKGAGNEKTFTIRHIAVGGIGVEKIYPFDLPSLVSLKVLKSAKVRRAKLYFLRHRIGKQALKLDEKHEEPTRSPRRKRSSGMAKKA